LKQQQQRQEDWGKKKAISAKSSRYPAANPKPQMPATAQMMYSAYQNRKDSLNQAGR
jgi:hypothetical protein